MLFVKPEIQKIMDIGVEKASEDPELERIINKVSGSDDFWYRLTLGGDINPSDILDSQMDIEQVEKAIQVIQEFEEIINQISYEM